MPLDMIYVDALTGAATLSNITIQATSADDTLDAPAPLTATFNAQAFPLSGADYLTPVSGDLMVSADTSGLSSGIYTYSLTSVSGRWQGLGRLMFSFAGFGVAGRLLLKVLPLVYVSVYAIDSATVTTPATVPTSAWR